MNNKTRVSICIPTYNRSEKVYKLVNDILNYKGDEIEVLVLDNCSTDNTSLLLSKIFDPRFTFIQNEKNIGGALNHLKVLTLAKGDYAFLCLDKDYVDYKNISKLLNCITEDEEVVFGHCSLNSQIGKSDIIYQKGFTSVLYMSYLSKHPTGLFYKTNVFTDLPILKQIFEDKKQFAFYPDLINAEMSFYGKSRLINLPLFYTETQDECTLTPSFTYNKNNFYFSPLKRIEEYSIYMKNCSNQNLLKNEKIILIKKLFARGLYASTIEYKALLSNVSVCSHHGMYTHKVSLIQLLKIDFIFSKHFLQNDLSISYLDKLSICLLTNIKELFIIVLRACRLK